MLISWKELNSKKKIDTAIHLFNYDPIFILISKEMKNTPIPDNQAPARPVYKFLSDSYHKSNISKKYSHSNHEPNAPLIHRGP